MDVIAYVCIETDRSKVRTAQRHRLVGTVCSSPCYSFRGTSRVISHARKQARC